MAETKLYPGKAFSPQAMLTDRIGAADTIIKVSDVSAFPDAPNLATIGTDEGGETILYTAKTTNALSGCQRGVEGTARSWDAGELIGRNFTAKDHTDLIAAVAESKQAAGEAKSTAESAAKVAEAAKSTAEGAASDVAAINEAKGAAGGFATLDESGVLPAGQRKIIDDLDSSKKYTLGVEGGNLYIMEV